MKVITKSFPALAFDSTQILAITRPEALYPGDPDQAKHLHRELAKKWHPDLHKGKQETFVQVNTLYHRTLDKIAKGQWEGRGTITLPFEPRPGVVREQSLDILTSAPFPLGRMLVTTDFVYYRINPKYKDLFTVAATVEKHFKFASDAMKQEILKYLPKPSIIGTLTTGEFVLRVPKTPDVIRLKDIELLDGKHVAWIVSSLLNLACYLSYAGIVHHDISPENYFISPALHNGALLGGWWYTAALNSEVKTVPRRTADAMPFSARMTKHASAGTDLELIRATAREILIPGTAPEPMLSWLTNVGHGTAVEQYQQWSEILKASFGPRRFVKLELTPDDVYR